MWFTRLLFPLVLLALFSCSSKPQGGNDGAVVDSAGAASDSVIFSEDEVDQSAADDGGNEQPGSPPPPPPPPSGKMVCDNSWSKLSDLEALVAAIAEPQDWREVLIQEVSPQLAEKIGQVSVADADNRGVLILVRGKTSGKTYKVLWTCDGQIIVQS